MKTQSLKIQRVQGSILLLSLCIAGVLGILMASYLIYTRVQNVSVNRSQNWNSSIVFAEAGVEEALAHLNRGAPYFDPAEATNNLASNGWTDQGSGLYASPRRYITTNMVDPAGGTDGLDYYDAYIQLNGSTPEIYATGFVYMPLVSSVSPQHMFATVNQASTTYYQSRRIKVGTRTDGLFNVAMAAIFQIDLRGNNITSDSFDSQDPNYSTSGQYPMGDLSKTKANGDIVTDGVVVDTLDVGNANIKGKIKTGPGGTIEIGPNGSVGDRAWVESGTYGIQPGHSANDMNVVFPDPTVPTTTYSLPTSGTVNGTNYDAVLTSGNYYLYNLGTGNYNMYVSGNATLVVLNNLNMTGNDTIRIGPSGSLKLYMKGSTASLGGNGVINETGDALNFGYYGTKDNTSLSYSGNANFIGTVYAPKANFTLGGGGSDILDFIGASVSKTVKMNGKYNFHYDESLARRAGNRGYVPTNWAEK